MKRIGRPRISREQAIAKGWVPNESGLCQCGCGSFTGVAKQTHISRGQLIGEPTRYLRGHAPQDGASNPGWKGDGVGYTALHDWLNRRYPRTGVCERCEAEGQTEYALIADSHVRDRDAYSELCVSCHRQLDIGGEKHWNSKLTSSQVHAIRQHIVDGHSDLEIANSYNVTPGSIWHIRTGRAWAEVS